MPQEISTPAILRKADKFNNYSNVKQTEHHLSNLNDQFSLLSDWGHGSTSGKAGPPSGGTRLNPSFLNKLKGLKTARDSPTKSNRFRPVPSDVENDDE